MVCAARILHASNNSLFAAHHVTSYYSPTAEYQRSAPYSKMHEIEEGQVGIHRFVVREEVIVKKSLSFLATIAQMTSFQSLLWNS